MTAGSTERRDFIRYPTNRVVGTVTDLDSARAAIGALLRARFTRDDIDILHGEKDLQRLDATPEHGFLAQFQRRLIRAFELEEFKHLTHHLEDIRAGRFVIMVVAKRRAQRIVAADILHRYGAEFVGFYGRWAVEGLPATAQWAPEDIPALFARAWNERDADALASLFDDDADFVDVDGLYLHDRQAIRKAHADGLARAAGRLAVAADATKVRRLSPEVAVVHAQLTRSADAADALAGPGPRTTIVSFVVHRLGDRWLCASAHSTEANPAIGTPAVDGAAVLGSAEYPGGQVS